MEVGLRYSAAPSCRPQATGRPRRAVGTGRRR